MNAYRFVDYTCDCKARVSMAGRTPPACVACGRLVCRSCGLGGFCPDCTKHLAPDELARVRRLHDLKRRARGCCYSWTGCCIAGIILPLIVAIDVALAESASSIFLAFITSACTGFVIWTWTLSWREKRLQNKLLPKIRKRAPPDLFRGH